MRLSVPKPDQLWQICILKILYGIDGTLIAIRANNDTDDDISMIIMMLDWDTDIPLYYYIHTTESVISIRPWGKDKSHAESRPPLFFNFRRGLLSLIFSKKNTKGLKTAISWQNIKCIIL